MLESFLYHLRDGGLSVSSGEWMDFMKALDLGVAPMDLQSLFLVGRTTLVKSEKHYDLYQDLCASYLKKHDQFALADHIKDWLENAPENIKAEKRKKQDPLSIRELYERLEYLSQVQDEQHDGGEIWIGAGGESLIGHSGVAKSGMRVDGKESKHKAIEVAGRRVFADFRSDKVLTRRQISLAMRRLRQMSEQNEASHPELDLPGTIQATADHAGMLTIKKQRPRKNNISLLLLMDSGGSMRTYSKLCNELFQAATQANYYKDVKVYYFHNCVYDELYTTPTCDLRQSVSTAWVLKNFGPEYRVILVGDGAMGPTELFDVGGNYNGRYNKIAGVDWLRRIQKRYPHHVWLNPTRRIILSDTFWEETIIYLNRMFPTFPLTLEGLEKAIHHLLTN